MLAKRHLINRHWENVCDPALLPYILVGGSGTKKYTDILLVGLVSLLVVIALAGPCWERLPQPVFQKESALVIALDLSLSMYANDIKPNRLERARFKIADLLNLRQEGQTALIVYAANAYTVTPLTDDIKTIKSQLPALSPEIMPAPGSNAGIAIAKSTDLLIQAGVSKGHILLITDEVEAIYEKSFRKANKNGYKVSILGLGTEEGAPIQLINGGLLKDRAGTIVIPKLNQNTLRRLARSGGGYYETSRIKDGDIERLNQLFISGLESVIETETEFETDQWHEFGPWLILLIIPITAFGFRRGYLAVLICLMFNSPDDVIAFEWDDLWLNKNQQAMRALVNEQADIAAELFQNNEWKAAAKYRAGDYVAAEELLNEYQDDRSFYNKANSLARQGRYEEAIAAYDWVLENEPEHEDALFNRGLLKKELENQQQQQDQQQSQSDQDLNKNQQQDSQSEDNQQQSSSDSGQQDSERQETGQSRADQQQFSKQQEEQEDSDNHEKQQAEKKQAAEQQAEKQLKEQHSDEVNEKPEQKQEAQQAMNELDEEQQATEQWLRRIPDDPSGLLRRKFKYQYQQQKRQSSTNGKYW